jgi:hypothetical protein
MTAGPVTTAPRVVLIVQSVLAVGFAVLVLVTSRNSDGWADLARFAGFLLGGVYLLGVVIAWALVRFVVHGTAVGVAVAVSVPPAVLLVAIAVLRAG